MTAAVGAIGRVSDRPVSVLRQLTVKEVARYARHPLFAIGFVLCWLTSVVHVDKQMSVLVSPISCAAGIGLFGLLVLYSLARSGDWVASSAGELPVSARTRTLALAAATVVPFTVGLAWYAWALAEYHHQPPAINGAPFGGVGNGWAYALLFALGPISCVGGPLLGLLLARWIPTRGAASVFAVFLVLAVILMQGIFVSLRPYRLFMPWTQFAGPYGVKGDPNRALILTGSPGWYCGYLGLLCVLGVLLALIPGEGPRRRLVLVTAGVTVLAVIVCVVASTTGVGHTMINPVHSFDS